MTYPTDCPCGSRCDGHAVAAPEDPGLEWDGIDTAPRGGHALMGGPEPMTLQDPMTGEVFRIIEETRYSDRSPREGWEAAWRVHRATR